MDSSAHNAVAAAFSDRDVAHTCYETLEREGFPHRWMAVTKRAEDEAWGDGSSETTSDNDVVESSDGALGAIGRFFSGEGNSLRRSLEDHGIDTVEAIAIDEALHLGGAVVVVAAHERSEIARSILRQGGGMLYGAHTEPLPAHDVTTETLGASSAAPGRKDHDGDFDLEQSDAALATVKTLELREEQLVIEKQRVGTGEASVGSRIVSEPVSVDVPVVSEELFVERHAVDGDRTAKGAIGDGETVVVPLLRDRVVVQKTTVVREEVVVGQRRVEGVERVRETLSHEELDLDEPARESGT